MGSKRVTLRDVARQTGASLSTVHRALYHKAGVSEKLRDFIIQTADQMGYRTNFAASSLKRKTIRLAILLPAPSHINRYFYGDLWNGLRGFLAEAQELNVEFLEFPFSGSDADQARELARIYERYADDLSGLLTISLNDASISYLIEQFAAKNIPVVFVSSDLRGAKRLCCVRAHDRIAGSLAAEWIGDFAKGPGEVIAAAGDIVTSSHSRNIEGFEGYLASHSPQLKIRKVYDGDSPDALYRSVMELLRSHPDVRALYSCNARDTVPICRAVVAGNLSGRVCVIGNDIFEESVQMLQKGVLQAIIYKDPYQQAYLGIQALFNYAVKGRLPPSETVFVVPTLVMKSNLEITGRYRSRPALS